MTNKQIPITIFADGASKGNPGPGGWGSIIATPDGRIMELGGSEYETTNNRMELAAVIGAFKALRNIQGAIAVYCDSVYVIRGITEWYWGWRKKNWKNSEGQDVANQDLWKSLGSLVGERGREHKISWHYVRGHAGIPGNERVDEIAVGFASGRPPRLYNGPLLKYDVAIFDIPDDTSLPAPRSGPKPKVTAHSYLSVINNVPMRHGTWTECEQRVKGRPGAKFKKAMSEKDESTILASWGYRLDDLKKTK
jgi:ribonuclease HI